MSEKIDWSKAPEWAKWHGLAGEMKSQVWFDDEKYSYVDGQQDGKAFFYCDACTYSSQDFSNVTFRPVGPSWSGEGLPPVGVVCRIITDDSAWWKYSGLTDGEDVTVCHSFKNSKGYDMVVVEACNGACLAVTVECVAPIRTPEQIAADERKSVIDVACYDIEKQIDKYNTTLSQSIAIKATIEAMIDAGYRKQEKPE